MDQGTQLERIIKEFFQTLDKPLTNPNSIDQFIPQLKQTSPIIINGNPIAGKQQFQTKWVEFPLTQHSVTSLDYHSIPGTNTLVINLSGKVRYDEAGKNRLGETSDISITNNTNNSFGNNGVSSTRNLWGSWFGFNTTLVVDDAVFNYNGQGEVINSLNYKIVYKPHDSLITI